MLEVPGDDKQSKRSRQIEIRAIPQAAVGTVTYK